MPSRSKSPHPQTAPPKPRPGPQTNPPLPSAGTPPQPTLEEAIRDLNALYVPGSLRTALGVAAYVRDRYLGGETEGFNPQLEAPSLRALAERGDLSFSVSYLSGAIGVFLQHPLLDPATAARLTLSHHRVLLGVPDAAGKNQLAALAVKKGLDTEALRVEVQKYRKRRGLPPIGHPIDDPALRALRRLYRGAGELNAALEKRPGPSATDTEARAIYGRLLTRLKKAGELLGATTRRKESF